MHDNINHIIRRANFLLLESYHQPGQQEACKDRLKTGFAQVNSGAAIERHRFPGRALRPDPDGSETASAARLVAQALGLRMVMAGEVPADYTPNPQDLVVWRAGFDRPMPGSWPECMGFCVRIADPAAQAFQGSLQNRRKSRTGAQDDQATLFP